MKRFLVLKSMINKFSSFIFRSLLFVNVLLLLNYNSFGQTTTGAIPTGSFTTGGLNSMPICTYYDYAWCAYILTKAELNTGGISGAKNFTQIYFYSVVSPGGTAVTNNLNIYIRCVSTVSYANTTSTTTGYGYPGTAGFTQVLNNGTCSFPSSSTWYGITFDAPFSWDGTSNIEILIENRDGSYIDPTMMWGVHTTYYTSGIYKAKYKVQDGSFPAVAGTRANRAAILTKFTYVDPCTPVAPTLTATANGGSGTQYNAVNTTVSLSQITTGGTNCGSWRYAWYNGSQYWGGSSFNQASITLNASYSSIAPTIAANTTYTCYVAGATGNSLVNNSVIVNVVTPPVITANADGTAGETIAAGAPVALTTIVTSAGTNCQGTWEYAWTNDNGTTYWNGSAFSGGANYNSTYNDINVTVTATKTFKVYARCSTTPAATSNSSVTVTVGSCSAPTFTAMANGASGVRVVITPSSPVALTANPSGGNYCTYPGVWEYAWYDGTNYFNGTDFSSGTAVYNTAWGSINPDAKASGDYTYTVYGRCPGNTSCNSSSNVDVAASVGCTAPDLAPTANGTDVSTTIPNNSTVNLDALPAGGANCSGTFVYAWSNDGGTTFWNGSAFSGAATYNSAYVTISVPNVTSNKTYTAYVKCDADAACNKSGSVIVNIGACAAPTVTAKANGSAGTVTVAIYDGVALTANETGGQYCDSGSPWNFAWYDGTYYWDGTSFSSASPIYSQGYNNINPTNITTNKTYTVYVKCFSNSGCNNSSSVTVNAGACSSPTLTARANGTATSITVASGSSSTLTANPSGGTYCFGSTFEYTWFDGSGYWNGTDFSSASEVYNSSYSSISVTNIIASKNYTLSARCAGNTSCTSTSSILIFITSTVFSENFNSSPTGWTQGTYTSNSYDYWTISSSNGSNSNYTIDGTANLQIACSGCSPVNTNYSATTFDIYDYKYIPINSSDMTLSFGWMAKGEYDGTYYDYGEVGYSLDGVNFTWMGTVSGSTNHGNSNTGKYCTLTGNNAYPAKTASIPLPATLNNTPFYLGFRFRSDANTGARPPFIIDNISITAPQALGTQISSVLLLNSGGSQQLAFNNSHINTTTPIFRVKASTSGSFDTYKIELNTNSTFTGTSYVQTFTGTYANNTEYNLTFNNFTPNNGTVYYVRACASGNGGTTWSSWTTSQHSFIYDNTLLAAEWYQDYQQQFKDNGYTATALEANSSNNIAFAPFSGGSNPFTAPGFEAGTGWSTKASYSVYTTTRSTDDNGTNGKTEGSYCLKFSEDDYSWQSFVNNEFNNASQQVDLTGITNLQFDITHWRNTQSNMYECGIGRACKVVWSFKVIIGNSGTSGDNSGTEVYSWTPTTAEFGVTNNNNVNVDISSFGFSGTKTVKFSRVVTNGGGVWYCDDKYYLDNIRTSSVAPTSGTYTSAPVYLNSFSGALNWGMLKWNQTLNGGTVSFKIQQYTGGSWQDVAGLTNITATGDGDKTYDISSVAGSDAQLRLIATMTQSGTSPVVSYWGLTATACTAPNLTAKANNVATSTTISSGTSVNFTANETGGVNCSDYFEFAWFDGTNYWNGSSFGSGSALYSTSYNNITFTPASTKTFTVTSRCHASPSCYNTSQVIVSVATPPASISAVIGTPANGAAHHLTVIWDEVSGMDGYGLEYSTNGSSWTSIGDITPSSTVTYDFNTADNPNVSYYFRIRSKLNSGYSGYTTMVTPTYTACDEPPVPTVSGVSESQVNVTINAGGNPAITTYSIYCTTSGNYVQSDGTLGAVEAFKTKAQWDAMNVLGLTISTQYCFYVKAQNNDGDIRFNGGTTYFGTEAFDGITVLTGNYNYIGSSSSTAGQWAADNVANNACGYGNAWVKQNTYGCTGYAIRANVTNAYTGQGEFINSPQITRPSGNIITVEWDMINNGGCSSSGTYINIGSMSGSNLLWGTKQTAPLGVCTHVSQTYDITAFPSNNIYVSVWYDIGCQGNCSNPYTQDFIVDNIKVTGAAPTGCGSTTNGPPLCGTYTVGPGGDFATITAAASALSLRTVTCDVYMELQSNYVSTSETYPISFTAMTFGAGGPFNVTFRPASGVSSPIVTYGTPANSTSLIVFNGASRLIFDGRKGGAGTDIYWNIQNRNVSGTTTIGPVITLMNDATYNTFKYLDIQGGANSTTSTLPGNVIIYTTTATTGNDFNTITYNKIHEYSSSYYPKSAVYAQGTSGKTNDDNTITYNELFNTTVSGVYINLSGPGNGNNWDIEYNHIYNAANVAPSALYYGIYFTPVTTSTGHKISNNFIGGHGMNCADPIWAVSSSYSTFCLIYVGQCSNAEIKNNTIQNIQLTYTGGNYFSGIQIDGTGTFTIDGNTIGHNSDAAKGLINNTQYYTYGIYNTAAGTLNITNNTIANLQSTYAGASAYMYGIYTTSGTNAISGNLIHDLSANNTYASDATVAGINNSSVYSGTIQTISSNTIYNLKNIQTGSYAHKISGIYHNGASAVTTGVIEKNNIYNISLATSNNAAEISGIKAAATYTTTQYTYKNNMIRLGYNSAGAAITTGYAIMGINVPVNTYSNFYHNSIYIGGSGVTSSSPTYAFYTTSTATNARQIQNNIFWNARSNGSGTAKNYAVKIYTASGLTSNYNILYASGTGNVLGVVNTTDYADLAAWKGISQDANSMSMDPQFENPTATTADLHIKASPTVTPVESAGNPSYTVTDDIDGQTRADFTPVDIGADAGNFTGFDLTPPVISYTLISNTAPAVSVNVTGFSITDFQSGVNVTSGTKPRLYYKKSTDANDNTGWKYVEANGSTSTFDFTINFTALNAGSVSIGDVIQYFVIAQDMADIPNVGINSGTFNSTPSSVNLTSGAYPVGGTINTFTIVTGISGDFNIGPGQTYTSFTCNDAAGFFKYLNSINGTTAVINGPINAYVTGDITIETGAVQLNALHYGAGGPYTITIKPDAATLRTVSGGPYVSGTGLLAFNGAGYVTFDGNYSGSGKYLKFTNSTSYVVYTVMGFINGANNITVKNCYLEGTAIGDNNGCIQILGSTGPDGNFNLTFDNNEIGNSSYINTRVYCNGSASYPNHDIAFTNNNIFNFLDGMNSQYDYGINVTATGNGNNWTITGNSFYATGVCTSGAYHQSAISFLPGSVSTGNTISGNYIGGNLPQCAAGTSPAPGYYCSNNINSSAQENDIINVNCGSVTISNNVIKNMRWTGSNQNVVLLNIAGTTAAVVSGNQFGDSDANYRVSTTSAYMTAINYLGGANNCQFTNNTVQNLRAAGGSYTTSAGININPANGDMTNLLVSGNTIEIPWQTSAATGYNYGIAIQGSKSISGSFTNNRVYDNTTGSGGYIYGIYVSGSLSSPKLFTLNIANNQVTLRNPNGNTATPIMGIYDNTYFAGGSTINYFYNSVFVAGTSSSTYNSAAFYRNGNGSSLDAATVNIKNNVFINTRSGGTGNHWTIIDRWASADSKWTAGCSDYNLLLNSNASSIGAWNSTTGLTFAQWQTNSSGDSHSINPTYNATASTYATNNLYPINLFESYSTGDLHIKITDGESYKFVNNLGTDLTASGITTDYDGDTRCPGAGCSGSASLPDIGSDEFASCTVPTVSIQPQTTTKCLGANYTFTVTVAGTAPLAYQWIKQDDDIPGATNSSYAINNITKLDANTYKCKITNICGTIYSDDAYLKINNFEITFQPANAIAKEGSTVNFTILASGSGLNYQWQENSTNLSDVGIYSNVTTATLHISDITGLGGRQYRCVVSSSDCLGSLTSDAALLTVTPSGTSGLWTGNVNDHWDETANWDTGYLPGIGDAVIIQSSAPNQPVIYSGIVANAASIVIEPKASLTVNSSGTLNIAGNLDVKSTSKGTGAFLEKDGSIVNIGGNATIERYISDVGYHYISSPIHGSDLNQIDDDVKLRNMNGTHFDPSRPPVASKMPNLWMLDEPHTYNTVSDQHAWLAPSGLNYVMQDMRGYALVVAEPVTLDIFGSATNLIKGDITYNLTKTLVNTIDGTTSGNGYHLIGNPYPSPIDWNNIESSGVPSGVNSTIAFFYGTSLYYGAFGYYHPVFEGTGAYPHSRYIPSMQAFYINNTSATDKIITFTNADRTVTPDAMNVDLYKKTTVKTLEFPFMRIRAYLSENLNDFDENLIVFKTDATENFDSKYDAYKLLNTVAEIPNIWSKTNNNDLAINTMPNVYDDLTIPIGFNAQNSGEFSLSFKQIYNFDNDTRIYLIDMKEAKTIEISNSDVYNFIYDTKENAYRFFIKFSKSVNGVSKNIDNNMFFAYSNKQNVIVNYSNTFGKTAIVSIYNIEGQKIIDNISIVPGIHTYTLSNATGIYYIKLITENKVYTKKLYISN